MEHRHLPGGTPPPPSGILHINGEEDPRKVRYAQLCAVVLALATVMVAFGLVATVLLWTGETPGPDPVQVAGRVAVAAVYAVVCGHAIAALRWRHTAEFVQRATVAAVSFGFATAISVTAILWMW